MEIINNKRAFRYEVELPGEDPAFLEYRWLKGRMVLMRTLVPPAARGKGIGSVLVKHVLDQAASANLKIIVYCGFVDKYIAQHSGYKALKDAPQE